MMTDAPESKSQGASPHPYATLLLTLLGVSALIGVCTGKPDTLPAIALGSPLLLYLERTIALFVGGLLLVVILTEAWRGNLPMEISGRGLKYERLRQETKQGLEGLVEAVAEERKAREEAKASGSGSSHGVS